MREGLNSQAVTCNRVFCVQLRLYGTHFLTCIITLSRSKHSLSHTSLSIAHCLKNSLNQPLSLPRSLDLSLCCSHCLSQSISLSLSHSLSLSLSLSLCHSLSLSRWAGSHWNRSAKYRNRRNGIGNGTDAGRERGEGGHAEGERTAAIIPPRMVLTVVVATAALLLVVLVVVADSLSVGPFQIWCSGGGRGVLMGLLI